MVLTQFLRSRWFFYSVLLLFVVETAWLALTSNYPMAFDESLHFEYIKFFSHHLNPIITSQDPSTYGLGAIPHDPSFLYRYLLSFPFRLIELFTNSVQVQVIALRFVNIGMAVASIVVGQKLLRRTGLGAALANLTLLLFAFTPIVTALSAQINYDNLVILATLATCYLTLKFLQALAKKGVRSDLLLSILGLCLAGSLVKFSFLPIPIGITIYLVVVLARRPEGWRALWHEAKQSFQHLARWKQIVLTAFCAISGVLWLSIYGVNLVKYHNPSPQCNQVLSIDACKHFYSWDRNYLLRQQDQHVPRMGIGSYTFLWARSMYYHLYAELVPTGGIVPITPIYYYLIRWLSVFAVLCVLVHNRKIFREYKLLVPTIVALFYLLILWARNYHDYILLGKAVAIQGRYLAPVLLFVYAFFVLGASYILHGKTRGNRLVQSSLVAVVIVSFVYWGGYSQYIRYISPSNHWQHQTIQTKA